MAEKDNDLHKIANIIGYCMELSQKKDDSYFFYNSLQNRSNEIKERIKEAWKSNIKLKIPNFDSKEWILLDNIVFNLRKLRYNLKEGNFKNLTQIYDVLKDLYIKLNFQDKSLKCKEQSHKILENLDFLRNQYKSEKKELRAQLNSKYKDKGLKLRNNA